MSDTPMTDKREKASEDVTSYCIDGWAMARALERELAATKKLANIWRAAFEESIRFTPAERNALRYAISMMLAGEIEPEHDKKRPALERALEKL